MNGELFERPKLYRVIEIDIPWNKESGGGKIKRGADRHYRLISRERAVDVIERDSPFAVASDAHLYLWVTNSTLADGIWVIRRLGFRYVTNIAWVKMREPRWMNLRIVQELVLDFAHAVLAREFLVFVSRFLAFGLGQYFRGSHELCLFGVRGRGKGPDVMTEEKSLRTVIIAPRRRHSQKPAEFYELVKRRSKGPRLRLFARDEIDGFDSWGDEVAKGREEPQKTNGS